MEPRQKIEYWIDIAEYDMKTAEWMLKSRRYLYVVFMCQQALEKLLKGVYLAKTAQEPPYSHNLSFIAQKIPARFPDEHFALFDRLTAFYIKGRYPSYKEKLSKLTDKREAAEILKKSKEMFRWLRSLTK